MPRGGLGLDRGGISSALRQRTIVGATPEKNTEEEPEAAPAPATETTGEAKAVIWGTTVNVEDVMDDFCRFLRTYAPRRDAGKQHTDPYYVRGLKAAHANRTALDVNCRHLHAHSADLYRNLVQYPQEVVPIMDLVATEAVSYTHLTLPTIYSV